METADLDAPENDMTEIHDSTENRADAVLARLLADQCLFKGTLGAMVFGAIGVVIAHVVASLEIHTRTSIATAFIGVMTAFGMRQWGWGIQRRFRVISLLLAVSYMLLSMVLAGAKQRAILERTETWDFFEEFVNLPFAWTLIEEALTAEGIFLFLVGAIASWLFSGRRLRSKDL